MKKLLNLTVVAVISFGLSGCSYKKGSTKVDKKFFKTHKDVKEKKYEELGGVSLVEDGWLFSSCNTMGADSIKKLELKAKSLGADAVVNVKWQGESGIQTDYPQCHTGWGWVLLWPAWFIPGTSNATISGTMIKYKSNN